MRRILDALFAPIARLLVVRGVLFAEATERLKLHYVQAAQELAKDKPTDSRISVMTGLQRREIARLLATDEMLTRQPPINHLSRLVALWQTDARFRDRVLPRLGGEISFEELARLIRRDVHPRSMLEQLVQAGTVSVDATDCVHLLQHSYQPLAGSEEQLAYLEANAGDFLAAAAENILSTPAPHFERAVHYNGLSPQAVATLDAMFREGQMALLRQLSTTAAHLRATEPGTRRFRAGGYFYTKDQE